MSSNYHYPASVILIFGEFIVQYFVYKRVVFIGFVFITFLWKFVFFSPTKNTVKDKITHAISWIKNAKILLQKSLLKSI